MGHPNDVEDGPGFHSLVIGVDYGTTYSGVSYIPSFYSDISQIVELRQWPKLDASQKTSLLEEGLKTPSRIAYAIDNKRTKDYWGYEVQPGDKQYSWMKLQLDKEAPPTKFDDLVLSKAIKDGLLANGPERAPRQITADYLREFYNHTIKAIEKGLEEQCPGVFDATPITWCLTKPAIWSDVADLETLRAATEAGLGTRPGDTVQLILEPEAAAFATIVGNSENWASAPKDGDSILICDCGGGTVDITGYIVRDRGDVLCLGKETCPALGGKCGSAAVDEHFRKWMTTRYGDGFTSLPAFEIGNGSKFMNGFEHNKKLFGTGKPFEEIDIQLSLADEDDSYYDPDWGSLTLTQEIMKSFFDPAVDKIIKLIETQIGQVEARRGTKVNKLFLVGGFGESKYLQDRLDAYLKPLNITVNRPPENSWSAIARGAVIRGLHLFDLESRQCRRSYGTKVRREWRPIDGPQNRWPSPIKRGKKKIFVARGYMEWFVTKGASIDSSTRIEVKQLAVPVKEEDMGKPIPVALYCCEEDEAPERYGTSVQQVGVVSANIASLPLSAFETTDYHGETQFVIRFTIVVLMGDKQGHLRFQCFVNGQVVGNAEIDHLAH